MTARHVIHTVGPVYGSGGPGQGGECWPGATGIPWRSPLRNGLVTVAFPAISTGIYGYPMDEAAVVSSRGHPGRPPLQSLGIREVRLVFFLPADAEVFVRHQAFHEETV